MNSPDCDVTTFNIKDVDPNAEVTPLSQEQKELLERFGIKEGQHPTDKQKLQVLAYMHKQMVINQPPYVVSINMNAKLKRAPRNKNKYKEQIQQRAYNIFKNKYPMFSTLDLDPTFWTNVFFEHFEINNWSFKHLVLPNGCCNVSNCNYTIYYLIISNEITRDLLETKTITDRPVLEYSCSKV
jgi:hypothetical protein